jgi:predicted lactoylglutathione lyase
MSAVAIDFRPERELAVEQFKSGDSPSGRKKCETMIALVQEWQTQCDQIIEENPSLEGKDREIVWDAKRMYGNVYLTLDANYDPCSGINGLFLCKEGDRVLSLAIVNTSPYDLHDGKIHGEAIEILFLVASPDNLALSIHPDRISGAGSAIIQKVIQIAQEHFYVGVVLDSLDSSMPFYEKYGFKRVFEDEPDENFMILEVEREEAKKTA